MNDKQQFSKQKYARKALKNGRQNMECVAKGMLMMNNSYIINGGFESIQVLRSFTKLTGTENSPYAWKTNNILA